MGLLDLFSKRNKGSASVAKERQVVVRVHPDVALQVIEAEPDFLKRLRGRTKIDLDLRDDPLLREDEFHLLAGPSEADVTDKYVTR